MQPDLRKLQRQCLPRVLFNIFRPSHLMIKYKREVFLERLPFYVDKTLFYE